MNIHKTDDYIWQKLDTGLWRRYPFITVNNKSILWDFHKEIISNQRWDLIPESRDSLFYCLN